MVKIFENWMLTDTPGSILAALILLWAAVLFIRLVVKYADSLS